MVLRGKSTPLSLALDLRGDYLSNQIFIGFTAYNSLLNLSISATNALIWRFESVTFILQGERRMSYPVTVYLKGTNSRA